jgi:hypothetical protein
MALKSPPLLEDRPPAQEIGLVVGGPFVFGLITGIFLGVSEPIYVVLSLLGIGGGFFAGLEHASVKEGFYRGLIGGLLFGTTILLTNAVIGSEPKAELPEPEIYLVAITTVAGTILGILGARTRVKRERATAAA